MNLNQLQDATRRTAAELRSRGTSEREIRKILAPQLRANAQRAKALDEARRAHRRQQRKTNHA